MGMPLVQIQCQAAGDSPWFLLLAESICLYEVTIQVIHIEVENHLFAVLKHCLPGAYSV